ncbi:helix-turn-helix domain-containing protein [Spirillospora sp. CA-294931]|uniref:helix-turn-helix domain-containing protein n=1 Tax=Spirillospora sp. CA-294931 TaxID=3240042 RepID=UPI003D9046DB
MPQPDNDREPSALVLHFGAELRHHRTQAELSLNQLGASMGYTAQWISQVELGKRAPSEQFAIDLDTQFKTDGKFLRHWKAVKKDKHRRILLPGFAEYLAVEAQASCIRSFNPQIVPGLLQTEDYARGVISTWRSSDPVEDRVAARMERQKTLKQKDAPEALFVLDEAVLHRPIGGPRVMREQLQFLASFHDSLAVQVRIVPFDVVTYAGLDGLFLMLTLRDGSELFYQEGPGFSHLIDDTDVVRDAGVRFNMVMGEALSRAETNKMLMRALEDLR